MATISKRAQSVDSSGIRKVFDLASRLKDPINLSIGQPDFDTFGEIKQGAIEAISSGKNSYTQTQGIEPLRDKLRSRYRLNNHSDLDVFLTSGVSGGIFLAFMSVLDPGDEVLIPDPFFCIYRDLARLIHAEPRFYDCYPDFKLRVERIEEQLSPRTRAILVNSPCNPTGYAATGDELDQVIELARKHNLWLIYDEIYERFVYDRPHAVALGKYENTIIVNGFSKSHAVPGWRTGFAIGPKRILAEMLKIQQYSFVCAPSVAQWGLAAGFEVDLSHKVAEYREKRDFVYGALRHKYEMELPGGAFYLFPRAPGGSGAAFFEKCLERQLMVIPGNVFSCVDSHFRLSYAAPQATLERGVEVLLSL